jgi:hypothetical protein
MLVRMNEPENLQENAGQLLLQRLTKNCTHCRICFTVSLELEVGSWRSNGRMSSSR